MAFLSSGACVRTARVGAQSCVCSFSLLRSAPVGEPATACPLSWDGPSLDFLRWSPPDISGTNPTSLWGITVFKERCWTLFAEISLGILVSVLVGHPGWSFCCLVLFWVLASGLLYLHHSRTWVSVSPASTLWGSRARWRKTGEGLVNAAAVPLSFCNRMFWAQNLGFLACTPTQTHALSPPKQRKHIPPPAHPRSTWDCGAHSLLRAVFPVFRRRAPHSRCEHEELFADLP